MHHLQESIIFEWLVGSKTCKFVSLYWFPSQTNNVFEKFADNLELILNTLAEYNPHVVLGDFNIKSKIWYIIDKTITEGAKIFTFQYWFHQIINEPTHILENSSSFTDLIFTLRPNLM